MSPPRAKAPSAPQALAPSVAPVPDPNADVAEFGYEQARDALVDIVRALESGGTTLEEALALWERAEALATRCEQWLDGARSRLETAVAARPEPDRSPS